MIFGAFERMVAFRYLRARRQEGFISVIAGFSLLGIAIGVATLIIVMSVMNGFRAELLGRILGVNGHLGIYGTSGPLKEFDHIIGEISGVPGITAIYPLVEGQVLASGPRNSTGAMVRGTRVEDIKRQAGIAAHITKGSLDQLDDDSVMIGGRMAFNLGLAIGDTLTILSPQGTQTAFGTVPRVKGYKVAAIFDVGEYQYDTSYIYMALPAAQLFFKLPDAVSSLEVFVADPDAVWRQSRAIAQILGDKVRLYDWQRANAAYFNAVQTEKNVMFLILTLIILVAAFNVISSMIMLVKDKGRDIAILRTMGATRGMILRIFFLSGASVGVIGTCLGFALGMLFVTNIEWIRQQVQWLSGTDPFNAEIYFLSQLPAKVDPWEVVTVVSMAFVLSFLATIYPSWRAARLDPVEALRYE